ncbi:MAG: 2-oxoacid:acceptor oxidoreductase family protein [candidate division WOR-3 bacterium]
MRTERLMAGSGGRGVILAGAVLAKAAAKSGRFASYGAIYGAEVRGGLTAAEIVISGEPIDFPFPETPELSFAFDQASYEKYILPHEPDRLILLDGDFIELKADHRAKVLRFPFTILTNEHLGNPVMANMMVIGFIAGITGTADPDSARAALSEDVSPRFLEPNHKAFLMGYERSSEFHEYY